MAIGPLCREGGAPVDGSIRYGVRDGDHHAQDDQQGVRDDHRANSQAGLLASSVPQAKGAVVYNGFDSVRLSVTHPTMYKEDLPAGGPGRPFTVVMTGALAL